MESPDKKELITEIVSRLKAYEESYEEGAWEEFNQGTKQKKAINLLWIGIAAMFAVILSALPFIFDTGLQEEPVIVKRKLQIENHVKPFVQTNPAPISKDLDQVKGHQVVVREPHTILERRLNNKPLLAHVPAVVEEEVTYPSAVVGEEEIKPKVSQQPTVKPSEKGVVAAVRKRTFSEFLEQEQKVATIASKPKTSKWNFGVELSPTVLQSKVNLGAGVTTEYKLSDKFSISSGISYVALNAGQKVTNPQPVSLMSNKKLVEIDANIRAIDIPISVTFNVNKQLYTAIGVSYFNVLSERRNNNYVTELEVSSATLNSAGGPDESSQMQVRQRNIEVAQDVPLDGNSYLGFMNFSIGHKQKLSKDHDFIIEPFLKVPVGKLSTEDLKLSNGGVKVRFSF